MSFDHWQQYLADYGTPERTRATLDQRARDRELFAEEAEAQHEVQMAEARMVEGDLTAGMATPYAAFDAAETDFIAYAAGLSDADGARLLAQQFGFGTDRVAEALDALNRMRAGGNLVLAGRSETYASVRVVEAE